MSNRTENSVGRNPVVSWQIVSTDPKAASRFYERLFGWTVSADNALAYREVRTGPGGVDGGIWPASPTAAQPPGANPPGAGGSFVQLFVRVADVDATVARAVELGGRIVVPRTVLPDGDTMAVIVDPTGLPFGLVLDAASRPRPP